MGSHTCPACKVNWQCHGRDPNAAPVCGSILSLCKKCYGTPAGDAAMNAIEVAMAGLNQRAS